MLKIKFIGSEDFVLAEFKKIGNIVQLTGPSVPQSTAGFDVFTDTSLIGRYEDYTTVYRVIDGAVQFSNDGSVWTPTITFTSNGGTLEGELVQCVASYKDLVVPTPVDSDDWKFLNWDKTIPTKGNIKEDTTYTAIFEDLRPEPEPVPSEIDILTERVDVIDETVESLIENVIPEIMEFMS